jgi:hypothetical protein
MVMQFNPAYASVPSGRGTNSLDKLISSAQLLAMFATPVEIVPAPGAGLALVCDGIAIHKPAGVAYGGIAAGEDLTVKYTNQAGLEVAEVETTGFLDQATAQTRYAGTFRAASLISSITPVVNAALVLALLVGEITTGDSPLHVRTFYRIVPAGAFAS